MSDPTILDYIDVAGKAVRGSADANADYIRGSDYDVLAGSCAVIWSRESQRDTDMFRAARFASAEGQDLTDLVRLRYGIDRILDSYGVGTVTFTRSGTSPGTLWAGTRISMASSAFGVSKTYKITADTPVLSNRRIVTVPVAALEVGPSSRVDTYHGLSLTDSLWDTTWQPVHLTCSEGTKFETGAELRARVRQTRLDARVGYLVSIVNTCKLAGADNVAVFRSDYAGDAHDHGLNVTYVGDLGYSGSPSLVKACQFALRSARVCGDNMQTLPMAKVVLDVVVDITLRDAPAVFHTEGLRVRHEAAIRSYLEGASGRFTFSRNGIGGAIYRNSQEVQNVNVITPSVDATITDANFNFPQVLNRYTVGNVTLRYLAP